ncbi:AraC family transcriptional regulator [Pseudopedobacter sp.]|uniref:helix-turn-helix domain-containing protein n=1 Tax=Pseudopedobacter sp. TaxID=1936787 RepID=UPI0033427D69
MEVAFPISGYLNLKTDNCEYQNVQSVLINSNVPHTFDCSNGECQLYFVDPTSYIGNQLMTDYLRMNEDVVVNELMSVDSFLDNYLSTFENKLMALKDDRIRVCLEWIDVNYSLENINISKLSEVVFLSESRLAHLFKEYVGCSVHQYILWKKIEEAIKLSQKGATLTECAHFSGFVDSSHFNRTFKNMFGIYPYFVLKE